MKLTIQIPDEVAELYQSRLRPEQTLEQVLAIQLAQFSAVDTRDRILVVLPEARQRLEELTTRMPLTKVDDLVTRVANLAELSIGRIRFRWTPAQWRQLKEKAERWRMPPAVYAEKVVRELEEQFFTYNPSEKRESIVVEQGR